MRYHFSYSVVGCSIIPWYHVCDVAISLWLGQTIFWGIKEIEDKKIEALPILS